MITAKQFIDYLYYKCLPTEWTSQDMNIYPVAPFYRYLQALVGYSYKDPYTDEEGNLITQHIGGFEQVINKANEFNSLIDPDTCPYEFFPYLYQSFGLNYDKVIETKTTDDGETIPIYYHRKFLKNIGELMKRRGTMSGLRYLVRVLTGLDFVYTYERKENGRFLHINLQLKSIQDKALSEEYLKAMEYIYRNTEYTVDLVINEDNYTPHVASVLEDLPFNRIIKVRNEGNISARLLIGDITIYVDESTQRRGYVNSKYAVPLKELSNLIKRRA
jgi:phage tail-like protein